MMTTFRTLAAALVGLAIVLTSGAGLAEDTKSAKEGPTTALAPVGDCAKPRVLARTSDLDIFDVTGPVGARFVPAHVAASMPPPPPPPVPPDQPGRPQPGVCDSPTGCGLGVPAFIESEPVPGLPPGIPGGNPQP